MIIGARYLNGPSLDTLFSVILKIRNLEFDLQSILLLKEQLFQDIIVILFFAEQIKLLIKALVLL